MLNVAMLDQSHGRADSLKTAQSHYGRRNLLGYVTDGMGDSHLGYWRAQRDHSHLLLPWWQ